MCGTVVDASTTECPSCGEAFSPVEKPGAADEGLMVDEEATADDIPPMSVCEDCDAPLNQEGKCPNCQPVEQVAKASMGCPVCQSKSYSKESGDLVSCSDCGNVYVMKSFEPEGQNWKWKFWVGLIFIVVGNVGVALMSYVHNVMRWSPLGAMYLGYGWMDQLVGAIGIILFILGLILFAWSFKREREIQCPSCKLVIRESQFEIFEPEEVEEELPKEEAIKSALDQIGEEMECPSCGAGVSMFDETCPSCGAVFEANLEVEGPEPEVPEAPEPKPGRLMSASELDEDEMIMESLELEKEEKHLNGNGISALDELEAAFEAHLESGVICPTCGARVGKGLDTCPGCGEELKGGE